MAEIQLLTNFKSDIYQQVSVCYRLNQDIFQNQATLPNVKLVLLTSIASAHAFIGCLAIAAIIAGLDLDSLKRAILFVAAVVTATGYTTADVGVGLFLRHNVTSCYLFCAHKYYGRLPRKNTCFQNAFAILIVISLLKVLTI